jgi:hypothetical protein
VTVPGAQVQAGTFWSMVMVESIATGSAQSALPGTAPDKARIGLTPTVRYGIQIATHMSQAGSRNVGLSGAQVMRQEGVQVLQFAVANTGERAYRPALTAELYDENGQLAARFQNVRGLVYPGSSVKQTYALPVLKPGSYKILIIADTGAERLFAAQYRVKL